MGLRVFASTSAPEVRGSPATDRLKPDFLLDNALLGITGQLRPELKLQLNVARQPTGELRFLDAIAQIEPSPYAKLWIGRMLPPIDRATLIGPLFASTWDVPFVAPTGTQPGGREDGVALWGDVYTSRLRYQVGAFRGARPEANAKGHLLYTGRVTLNLLETEPGYYHFGTTYGAREVLSFGLGAKTQTAATGTLAEPRDTSTIEADVLLEKNLPNQLGTLTLEGAIYRHTYVTTPDASSPRSIGWYGQLGYLNPTPIGPGRIQVVFRYQQLNPSFATRRTREDLNVNYIVQGHPLRFGLVLFHDASVRGREYGARLGAQLIL